MSSNYGIHAAYLQNQVLGSWYWWLSYEVRMVDGEAGVYQRPALHFGAMSAVIENIYPVI